jgi:Secretion system C-terminal sorting domain/Glucose / Sorbosone dehydrogenase
MMILFTAKFAYTSKFINVGRRAAFFLLCILYFHNISLNAQPKVTRPDISIKELGVIGVTSVRIRQDPTNGNIYILQRDGTVNRVNFKRDSTSVTLTSVYTTSDHGLISPLGMAFGKNGVLYLAGDQISNPDSEYTVGIIMKGIPDSAGSENRTWEVLAQTVRYPYGHVYAHQLSGIAVDPNGKYIYVNSGARTDHGEMEDGMRGVGLTDIILKLPVDTSNILLQDDRNWLEEHGYVLADGTRNSYDLAFNANGDLIAPDNSDDRDDPEELNWIQEGHHYGFPWIIGLDNTPQQFHPYDPHTDPLLSPTAWGGGNLYVTYSNDPTYPPKPDSITFTAPILSYGPDADKFRDTTTGDIEDASDLGVTIPTFTAHRSVDGITFDNDSVLAGDLKGDAFVVSFANGSNITALGDTGQDLMAVSLTKHGDTTYTAHVNRLVAGLNSPLSDILIGNKLFVMETGEQYGANPNPKLWEVTLPEQITAIKGKVNTPYAFNLNQNYPNPFNPTTTISWQLPVRSHVMLEIYNILGRKVSTLVNEAEAAGNHKVKFNAVNLASGIYFYSLTAVPYGRPEGSFHETKKLILLK